MKHSKHQLNKAETYEKKFHTQTLRMSYDDRMQIRNRVDVWIFIKMVQRILIVYFFSEALCYSFDCVL